MTTDFTDEPPPPEPPTDFTEIPSARTPRVPRASPLIAWMVIVAVVVGLFELRLKFPPAAETKELDSFELQGRLLVGAANLGPKTPTLYDDAKTLNHGSAAQRLRFVALAGELKDPDEAIKQLDALKEPWDRGDVPDADDKDRAVADILGRLYHDYADGDKTAKDVTEEERQELQRRLGWFGELALNPRGGPNPAVRAALIAPSQRSVMVTGGIALAAFGGAAVGFILLILFFALWRQMRSRFAVGSPYGGVYAETFALWLILYLGMSLGFAHFAPGLPLGLGAGLPQLLSLSALGWPVLRGVPWRQVRQDIGWRAGDRPLLEPFYGVLCYLAALPVVIAGLLVLAMIIKARQEAGGRDWFGPTEPPMHPIVDPVLHSGVWGWIQALFVASVMAPLVEETMFRGVLYRHMREATRGSGRGWSVVLSAVVVSFVFAALHPQGVLAIPLLMALACGFTAAREWRGSLIPSMAVHALHNGTLMLILILAAG